MKRLPVHVSVDDLAKSIQFYNRWGRDRFRGFNAGSCPKGQRQRCRRGLDVFCKPIHHIARSLTDTFSGIAPTGVLGFAAAQLAGALMGMFAVRALNMRSVRE